MIFGHYIKSNQGFKFFMPEKLDYIASIFDLIAGEAIKHLFIKPITTIKEIEHDLKISNKSAYNLISTLLKKGIVYNISNKQRGAKYCFKDLMDILEDEI